jgi:hypothetical protein
LGYNNDVKGYCLLDVHTQKVFISDDVFNEDLPILSSTHQVQTTSFLLHKPNLDTFTMAVHLIPLHPCLVSFFAFVIIVTTPIDHVPSIALTIYQFHPLLHTPMMFPLTLRPPLVF